MDNLHVDGRRAGGDAVAVARENAHFLEELRDDISPLTGIPTEMLCQDFAPQATSQFAAMATPPEPPPAPPPGLIGELGDKGIKPLLETLTNVSEGAMERESAVEFLIVAYGISREQAELLVPDKALPHPTPARLAPPRLDKAA